MKLNLEWLEKLNIGFSQLTKREKVLTLLSGLSLVFLGGFYWFIEPKQLALEALLRTVERQKVDLVRLDSQIKGIEMELLQDPDEPLRQKMRKLEESIAKVDGTLREQTVDLIPANKMPDVLHKILERSSKLKVIKVSSIAPVRMMDIDAASGKSVNLFQHGVSLVLQGQYMDILNYLEEIEDLEWRFYWKRFDYLVDEYPVANAEIELYTLSTNEAFIGV
ncbi:hypothetical protein [Alteromonas sp. a30]|uniref:hypothetical protein n=1 Tax=Alteromonas sp. a30 TaxID=2730917 RepID=UPI00227DC1A9|nr:hypothetical protein [Alteromonas sp. a30]MCY7295278.1 MSHA biogenesis protein MshJ [Alteromonas sp. a30]